VIRPLLLLAALACAKRAPPTYDLSLPESRDEVRELAPAALLAAAADDEEPGPRGRALEILVARSSADALPALAARGLWDPDGWVQRRVVHALGDRIDDPGAADALRDFVRRSDGVADPHARAIAAERLGLARDPELAAALTAAWRAERTPWRRAPLQLAAGRLGDDVAIVGLSSTIADGELGLDPEFLLDVGRSGLTALLPSFAEAWPHIEDDIRLAFLTARLLLGDTDAEKLLRSALTASDELAVLEALDFLTAVDHPAADGLIGRVKAATPLAQTYAGLALQARGDGPDKSFDDAIASPNAEIRELAARFAAEALLRPDLPRKPERVARRVLDAALDDPIHAVRLAGARGLPALAADKARAMLTDEILAVRIEAARLLLDGAR
jgi:hypothetical protein